MISTLIVLASDGRHVSVGRASQPSEAEIAQYGAALQAQSLGGWYVRMDGDYYGKRAPRLTMLREIAPSAARFSDASAIFEAKRAAVCG